MATSVALPTANVVKPSALLRILTAAYSIMRPLFIWGPPGVGKSEVVRQWADATFLKFYPGYSIDDRGRCRNPEGKRCQRPWLRDIRASLLDPVDLRGVPYVELCEKIGQKLTQWARCGFLPADGYGVIFLDELVQAPDMVQSALLQLVLDRQLGEFILPDGWLIVAGGNRVTDGTFSRKLSKALGSRFGTHLELAVDNSEWLKWAKDNNISPLVQAYLMRSPDALHMFDPQEKGNSFPCPRTWAIASEWLPALAAQDRMAVFTGLLGQAHATEFVQFLQMAEANLPTLDEVVADPKGCKLPTDPSARYAVANGFSRAVDAASFGPVLDYVGRMSKEFEVLFVNNALKADETLADNAAFTKWALANPEVVLG